MASNSSANKRQRTATDTLHISDLPVGFIVDTSAYLAKPSRALLAVAFTAPSSSSQNNKLMHRPSPISTAIISASHWDTLDFKDVNKELANKLTDDDISAVLECINAQDVLKRLKLCGCINITGIGLNPLRGSKVEQIDISLVGKHDEPKIEAKISQEVVLPILDSIISSDGCSLKHITFPHILRARSVSLFQFRERYNILYNSRRLNCFKCNAEMSNIVWMRTLQNNVCYDCLAPFCGDCTDEDGHGNETLNFCSSCDKDYCVDCVSRTDCADAVCVGGNMCSGCAERSQCQQCNETRCEGCLNTCNGCNRTCCEDCLSYRQCQGENCDKGHCQDCYNGEEYDVNVCEECVSILCTDCNLDLIKKDGMECRACAPDTVPLTVMLEEIAKHKEEMGQLRKENEELREKLKHISL